MNDDDGRKPTYSQVLHAIEDLRRQNKKITHRAILAIAGGSPNVLQERMDKIKEIESLAIPTSIVVPEQTIEAIRWAIAEYAQRRIADLEETIRLQTENLQEANDHLSVAQEEGRGLRNRLQEAEKEKQELRVELEKKISAAHQQIIELGKDRQALEIGRKEIGRLEHDLKALQTREIEASARAFEMSEQLGLCGKREASLEAQLCETREQMRAAAEREKRWREDLLVSRQEKDEAARGLAAAQAYLVEKDKAAEDLLRRLQDAHQKVCALEEERKALLTELKLSNEMRAEAQKKAAVLEVRLSQQKEGNEETHTDEEIRKKEHRNPAPSPVSGSKRKERAPLS